MDIKSLSLKKIMHDIPSKYSNNTWYYSDQHEYIYQIKIQTDFREIPFLRTRNKPTENIF